MKLEIAIYLDELFFGREMMALCAYMKVEDCVPQMNENVTCEWVTSLLESL